MIKNTDTVPPPQLSAFQECVAWLPFWAQGYLVGGLDGLEFCCLEVLGSLLAAVFRAYSLGFRV